MTRTLDGWPAFVLMLVFVALVYAAPAAELKWAALAGLAFLSLATLLVGGRKELSGAPPTRRRGGGGRA